MFFFNCSPTDIDLSDDKVMAEFSDYVKAMNIEPDRKPSSK